MHFFNCNRLLYLTTGNWQLTTDGPRYPQFAPFTQVFFPNLSGSGVGLWGVRNQNVEPLGKTASYQEPVPKVVLCG
jgi:hypothetical protein